MMKPIYTLSLLLLPILGFGQNNLYDFEANPLPDSFTYFHIDENAISFLWVYKESSQAYILKSDVFTKTLEQHWTNEYKHLIEEKGVKHVYLDLKIGYQYFIDNYFKTGDESYLELIHIDPIYFPKLRSLRPYVVNKSVTVECYQDYFYYDMWTLNQSIKTIAFNKHMQGLGDATVYDMWDPCEFFADQYIDNQWDYQDEMWNWGETNYPRIQDSMTNIYFEKDSSEKQAYLAFYNKTHGSNKRNIKIDSDDSKYNEIYSEIMTLTNKAYSALYDAALRNIGEKYNLESIQISEHANYYNDTICAFFKELNKAMMGTTKKDLEELLILKQKVMGNDTLRQALRTFFGNDFHYVEAMFESFPYAENMKDLTKKKNALAFYQIRVNKIHSLVLRDTVNKSFIEINDNMFAGLCGCKRKITPYQQEMYLQLSALAKNSYWMQSDYNSAESDNLMVPEDYDNKIGYYQFTNTTVPVLYFLFKYTYD